MSKEESKVIGAVAPGGNSIYALKVLNDHAAREAGGLKAKLPRVVREVVGKPGQVSVGYTEGHSVALPRRNKFQSYNIRQRILRVESKRKLSTSLPPEGPEAA